MGAHFDPGFLTMFPFGTSPDYHYRNRQGQWRDPPKIATTVTRAIQSFLRNLAALANSRGSESEMADLRARKSLDAIMAESIETGPHALKRTLGPFNLVGLGVGATIGIGVFVLTGIVSARYTGP